MEVQSDGSTSLDVSLEVDKVAMFSGVGGCF
jgi:hypothetical protein